MTEKCEGNADHDRLIRLEARFEEYRIGNEKALGKLNELREQTNQFQQAYLRYDVYSEGQQKLDLKIETNYKNLDERVGSLSTAQSRMLGMGAALITVATLAGAIIGALIGHVWK